jgi:DNA modification methylase
MTLIHDLRVEQIAPRRLIPYTGNARTHSDGQVKQIARSIERFGFTNPVLVDDGLNIIAGHGRVLAALKLGLEAIPVLRLKHLSERDRRAYILADNKLAQNAGWDKELLAIELQWLIQAEFDVQDTGFSVSEVDQIIESVEESNPEGKDEPEDRVPEPPAPAEATTKPGEVWQLGRHRLYCGDCRSPEAYAALCAGEQMDMIFTDPPYNVPIDGHVGGLGSVKHREFAFASGEMSREAFTAFLRDSLAPAVLACRDGAIAFVCMDWRHIGELLDAASNTFTELKNLCVWNKTNAGMGSFYRSKHELVFVFKAGTGAHTNTFGLGETGRYRTNVWDYAGVNTLRKDRMEELSMHPTVKPVALVADAIRDVTRRGDLVLDPFGGSGTTLIAAERTGRTARLIEIDPAYCDVIRKRYETYTGRRASLMEDLLRQLA